MVQRSSPEGTLVHVRKCLSFGIPIPAWSNTMRDTMSSPCFTSWTDSSNDQAYAYHSKDCRDVPGYTTTDSNEHNIDEDWEPSWVHITVFCKECCWCYPWNSDWHQEYYKRWCMHDIVLGWSEQYFWLVKKSTGSKNGWRHYWTMTSPWFWEFFNSW